MATFAYSSDQITQIFDSANRCGQIRKDWLKLNDHDVDVIYRQNASERKELRRKLKAEKKKKVKDENLIVDLEVQLQEKVHDKEYIEQEIKDEVLNNILHRNFHIKVNRKQDLESGKYIYITGDDRDSFFACKIINDELQKTYKIKQPDRNVILKNVKLLLSDQVDKLIIRGDIKSFFESIPKDRLLGKIRRDGIISHRSMKLMNRMFYDLSQAFDYNTGVPRGISFSPSLADIYLRDIDASISKLDGIYLYQRYVDDVIIIASPSPSYPNAKSLFKTVENIFNVGGLFLHTEDEGSKYMAEDIHYSTIGKLEFDYLGYHITLDKLSGDVSFLLTQRRVDKYESQIDKALNYYLHTATHNPRKEKKKGHVVMCHRQPLRRFKKLLGYLTCNYYLGGAKCNILSGIYFKHTLLTDISQLEALDKKLAANFKKLTPKILDNRLHATGYASKLKKELTDKYSFVQGYQKRRMCHMTSADFKMIKHVLQYEEAKN